MPLDEKPQPGKARADRPAASSMLRVQERLSASGQPPLSQEQFGLILPFLDRLHEVEGMLNEAKLHLNPASPLADRVAAYFARTES